MGHSSTEKKITLELVFLGSSKKYSKNSFKASSQWPQLLVHTITSSTPKKQSWRCCQIFFFFSSPNMVFWAPFNLPLLRRVQQTGVIIQNLVYTNSHHLIRSFLLNQPNSTHFWTALFKLQWGRHCLEWTVKNWTAVSLHRRCLLLLVFFSQWKPTYLFINHKMQHKVVLSFRSYFFSNEITRHCKLYASITSSLQSSKQASVMCEVHVRGLFVETLNRLQYLRHKTVEQEMYLRSSLNKKLVLASMKDLETYVLLSLSL